MISHCGYLYSYVQVNCIKIQSTYTIRVNTTVTKRYSSRTTTTTTTTQETEVLPATNTSDLVDVVLFEKVSFDERDPLY